MLDKIQFFLSLQILGFCIFGGFTLLLRARDNRAKRILGWSMFLWAFLAAVRISVNLYVDNAKEVFDPDILFSGCLVSASLACYVIEVLHPGYLTLRRILYFISPVFTGGLAFFIYRLSGGEIHVYYTLEDVFIHFNIDMVLRILLLLFTLFYMALPIYLVLKYSKGFTKYLSENVADPEEYDLNWLKKIMFILVILYVFYLILLLTDRPVLYVIDKAVLLIVWYYFFYKALFLKVIHLDHSFEKGWDIPYDEEEDDDQHSILSKRYVEEVNIWFEKEKPYLREDLRLTDLQRVFPISRSYLSQLFNKELGCSFSDYVNGFRVEESKRLLEAEPMTSIQEIAERSGFHSISTFRRAFVKSTGVMPSEYRK